MTLVVSHVVRTGHPPTLHPEEWLTICLESGHRFNILGETLSGVGPPSCHTQSDKAIFSSMLFGSFLLPSVCSVYVCKAACKRCRPVCQLMKQHSLYLFLWCNIRFYYTLTQISCSTVSFQRKRGHLQASRVSQQTQAPYKKE